MYKYKGSNILTNVWPSLWIESRSLRKEFFLLRANSVLEDFLPVTCITKTALKMQHLFLKGTKIKISSAVLYFFLFLLKICFHLFMRLNVENLKHILPDSWLWRKLNTFLSVPPLPFSYISKKNLKLKEGEKVKALQLSRSKKDNLRINNFSIHIIGSFLTVWTLLSCT